VDGSRKGATFLKRDKPYPRSVQCGNSSLSQQYCACRSVHRIRSRQYAQQQRQEFDGSRQSERAASLTSGPRLTGSAPLPPHHQPTQSDVASLRGVSLAPDGRRCQSRSDRQKRLSRVLNTVRAVQTAVPEPFSCSHVACRVNALGLPRRGLLRRQRKERMFDRRAR